MSIPNQKSQGADILRPCSSLTMCHISLVTCHMSGVRCPVSGVNFSFHGKSDGASQWRVFYQRGLPCLVYWLSSQFLGIDLDPHVLFFFTSNNGHFDILRLHTGGLLKQQCSRHRPLALPATNTKYRKQITLSTNLYQLKITDTKKTLSRDKYKSILKM